MSQLLSLGLEKYQFPILLLKTSSPFKDASFLTCRIFFFLNQHVFIWQQGYSKQFLPLHPGELVMSPDWTASLKWREQAVTTGQGGTTLSASGCCPMWAGLCLLPLFSCLSLLSIHPKLLGTKILMWIQTLQSIWTGSWPISYYFTPHRCKYSKLRYYFIFSSPLYNSTVFF